MTGRARIANGTTVTCGCGADITPRYRKTFPHCPECAARADYGDYERGQLVAVPDDWQPLDEGDTDIRGLVGVITGRYGGDGCFEVFLQPPGYAHPAPFALYPNEFEAA